MGNKDNDYYMQVEDPLGAYACLKENMIGRWETLHMGRDIPDSSDDMRWAASYPADKK